MAKKSKYGNYIAGGIALLFGILTCCMMFLEAVSYTADLAITKASYSYTGSQLVFGYKETLGSGSLSVTTTILNFNFMALLAFFLPLVGGLLAIVTNNGLISKILTTACFVVGAVFLFTLAAYAPVGMSESQAELVKNLDVALGIGPILGGVFSVIGAVVCFFKGSIAKKF